MSEASLRLQLEAANIVITTLRSLIPQEAQQQAEIAESPCARACEINAFKKQKAQVVRLLREGLTLSRETRTKALVGEDNYDLARKLTVKIAQALDELGVIDD